MTADLHFNRFGEWPAAREALPAAERAARAALDAADPGAVEPEEISFTCLAPDEIAEMNRRYLDRDGATDVIAFPLSGPGAGLAGDVYLCPEVAGENAADRDLPPAQEVVRLVAHGALHVLGHDHPEGEGREGSEMYRLQEELVRRALAADDGAVGGTPPEGGAGGGGPAR